MYRTSNKKKTIILGNRRKINALAGLFLILLILSLCGVSSAQENIAYDDEGRRDPFIALVTPDGRLLNLEPTGTEAKVVLGGIIYDKSGSSYAIINDEVVSAGDYIIGYNVVRIESNKVILLKDNKIVEFKLNEAEDYTKEEQ